VNGLPQQAHILVGKLAFLIPLGIHVPIQLESTMFYFIPILGKSLETCCAFDLHKGFISN
jgi:hypothetical protein